MIRIFSRWATLSAPIFFVLSGSVAAGAILSDDALRTAAIAGFVERALVAHPRDQAAAAAVDAEAARSRAAVRPLFNPDLELEYGNSEIDTTTLEISQTLDWHDKRSARKRAGEAVLEAARAAREALRERLAGEILAALADLDRAARLSDLATERVKLLERFVALHERSAAAGDIGQTELQLARLALAEANLQQADAASNVFDMSTSLAELAGAAPDRPLAFPERIPDLPQDLDGLDALATRHPAVREARLHAAAAERRIRESDLNRRPDPTIGLKGGREDQDTLVGLRLELPLQVRNDFSERVDAAKAEALEADRKAYDRYRIVRVRLDGAWRRFELTRRSLTRWRDQGRSNLSDYTTLLETLWKSGEIGSAEYLVQLRQALDTRVAGERIKGKAWRSWVDWLSAAGRVREWLGLREAEGA